MNEQHQQQQQGAQPEAGDHSTAAPQHRRVGKKGRILVEQPPTETDLADLGDNADPGDESGLYAGAVD